MFGILFYSDAPLLMLNQMIQFVSILFSSHCFIIDRGDGMIQAGCQSSLRSIKDGFHFPPLESCTVLQQQQRQLCVGRAGSRWRRGRRSPLPCNPPLNTSRPRCRKGTPTSVHRLKGGTPGKELLQQQKRRRPTLLMASSR